jgi:DNA-binding protein
MATTISPQTLTVTLSSAINLNGQPINSENQLTIPSIASVDKRIVSVPTSSQVTLLTFGSSVAAGQLITGNVKFVSITNKDSTNYVRLRVTRTNQDTFDVKIDAGGYYIMMNPSESVSANGSAFSSFVNAYNISAQADTGAVDVEIFAASI